MTNKPRTIKKRSEFVQIGKYGSRAKTSALISICFKFDASSYESKVGYTASKRVGNAVARNKAKRRMRNLVSNFRSEFSTGYSFVFIATAETVNCQFLKLQSDFLYCIRKAKERADAS